MAHLAQGPLILFTLATRHDSRSTYVDWLKPFASPVPVGKPIELSADMARCDQPYAASTFAVETSISTERPRKSKRTRIRSFAGSK